MQKESEEMIRQYSFAKNGDRRLAPDFKVRELRCRDGSDTVMVDETLTVVLQCIREHFGKPVTITSGYRTAAHNAAFWYPRISATSFPTNHGSLSITTVLISPNSGLLKI